MSAYPTGRVARAGRSGTAYSLVATDEMPYLLDLHLFLGKPVKWVTDRNSTGTLVILINFEMLTKLLLLYQMTISMYMILVI